jgi:ATP-dependent protease Clp ATPase subunit
LDLSSGNAKEPLPDLRIETDGILFVGGGEFAGLDDIIGRRGRHAEQPITNDDLIAFGMPAALANRFQCIFRIEPLDEGTMGRVVSFVDLAMFLNEMK